MDSTFAKKVENYIRALFPLLSIETMEETNLLKTLKGIATERNRELRVWSLTRGCVNLSTGKIDRIDSLDAFVRTIPQQGDTINVMLDTGFASSDPVFIRSIKDVMPDLKSGRTLILAGVDNKLSPDLNGLVTTIWTPLPSRDELKTVLVEITESNKIDIDGDIEKVLGALTGLTTDEAGDAISLSIVETKKVDPTVIMREKVQKLRRPYLQVIDKVPTPEEIGGLDELKDFLLKRVRMFSTEAKEYGLPMPKGFMMVGVPGCGKSLVAKATASVLGLPLIKLDIGAVMGGIVGDSERNIRDCISIAEVMSPVVLWVDELDKQLSPQGGTADGSHEVTKRVMSSLLTWLQEKTAPVFIVATANNIMGLASSFPELLRRGRWDETWFVDLPNADERREIFKIHACKVGRAQLKLDYDSFTKQTDGFSGAEIEAVVKDSLFLAFGDDHEVSDRYVFKAIESCVPQSKLAEKTITELRQWAIGRARRATATPDTGTKTRKIEK